MTSNHYFVAIVLIVTFLTASFPAGDRSLHPKAKPKIVLRLPYRGLREKPSLSNPYSLGMFEDEIKTFFAGGLAATDWERNIYIIDRQNFEIDFLKCFDKHGKFREFWKAFIWRGSVAVTKDGYVWVPTSEEKITGLPIMVFQKGKKLPVRDWRFKLPAELKNKIEISLRMKGFEWREGWFAWGWGIEGSVDKVMMRFMGDALIKDGRIQGRLLIIASSDGEQILNVEIKEPGKGKILSANGDLWFYETDFDRNRWTWSKLWLWQEGKERGEPFIDRTKIKEPWLPHLLLGEEVWVPIVHIDTKGNIYLIWQRNAKKNFRRKFIVEGEIIDYQIDAVAFGNNELALIVLDKQKRLLAYLPWTHAPELESELNWIKPLPDGSGFYRIEYREREAVIYFHPLPK